MNKMEAAKLQKILTAYLKEIHEIYAEGNFREESFYPALKDLFENCSHFFITEEEVKALVLPKKTEVGIPDFRIRKDGEIIGHIEAKVPDSNLHEIEKTEQIQRYRNALPNLIVTNFLEFWLYRNGTLIDKIELCSPAALHGLKAPVSENVDAFFDFINEFYSFSTPEIRTASELAITLADKTKFSRHILKEVLERADRDSIPLESFYEVFRKTLIGSLTEERFVDLYAQTITYGLFAAKITARKEKITKENAWEFIPGNVPLLSQIFHTFVGPTTPEAMNWIIEDLLNVLNKTDVEAITREKEATRDPIIHFYDTFLGEYNPEERAKLGVYYTPPEVVDYIVKSIHKLLKEKFGKEKGLAEEGLKLLDPAAGTLTFIIRAFGRALFELQDTHLGGMIPLNIKNHILSDFYAFEIQVVPYIIGHLRVAMSLEKVWDYEFAKDDRFQFYLTNTLEMKEPEQELLLPQLTEEGREARKVKEKEPILVILGNPPYSVSSENKSDFIKHLMEDYKKDVKQERNIQPLSDDYIKFIRFAHWKISQTGKGIFGYISNNSYLSGVIHRGMRKELLETFDEVYILNLHGSSRIGEKTPEGGKDENVFDIQQGVAIAIYVKLEKPLKEKKVRYADVWGLRDVKYKYLRENDVTSTDWLELKPKEPYYFFVPKDFALQGEYDKFWKVTEIFKESQIGLMTGQDDFFVDTSPQALKDRILAVFDKNLSDNDLNTLYNLKSQAGEKTILARTATNFNEDLIRLYCYRPFDIRYVYTENKFLWRSVESLKKHFVFENIALVTTRILASPPFNHVFVAQHAGDNTFISSKTKERNYFFPLYLYSDERKVKLLVEEEPKSERTPNFTDEFLLAVKDSLGKEPTPEDIFYYIYAVLYSPTYRKRYEEFLKIDFPRVPIPTDYDKFKNLSELGKELVELHLLKHPSLSETEIGFPVSGSNTVEKVRYDEENRRVYFNKEQYFDGISKEVWEYRIGAYQVLAKYLKDRKKRELTWEEIEHYMNVAKAIERTMEVQRVIDERMQGLI
ncbi:MAG: type ISP restriction/modification enzyme [Euryarchaeota archaeon]|nr:type ISP restriction/modification enzyme [Euryarchaeota archaeon]